LTLGEKVSSGLVWRFGTFNCISDNLACFKDGFSDSVSFLDVSSHRFYVTKPFLERVTVDGFCVARTRGTTRWTLRFERRGLYT
jgi:hypothetical protein